IVSAPALGVKPGRTHALVAALDLAPTFVELAGGTNDTVVGGREVLPMTGRSIAPLLRGEAEATRGPDEVFALEHGGQRAVFRGGFRGLWLMAPDRVGGRPRLDRARA